MGASLSRWSGIDPSEEFNQDPLFTILVLSAGKDKIERAGNQVSDSCRFNSINMPLTLLIDFDFFSGKNWPTRSSGWKPERRSSSL